MKVTNKNFIYNIVYQIFIFIVPLITTPYISRILGVENIGIYSYSYSLVYYFMLCGMIGINNYGSRTVAKINNDKQKLSDEFWSIYILQLFLTSIIIIAYFVFVIIFKYEYKNIMLIQSVFLVSVAFDINWLFYGLEKFKITISRNIIIKILSMFFIFLIVKEKEDLWIYTIIMAGSTLLSQMYLWFYVKKSVYKIRFNYRKIISHIKPCLILFIPVVAYSIYRVMDKTMIGAFSNSIQLGNYESAEKIINIPLSFVAALGTVMLPHMSKQPDENVNKKIGEIFNLCLVFIIPMCIGLFIVSSDFSIVFFGDEFSITAGVIKFLIPTIIFASIANVIRTNYLIPKSKDRIYVISTIIGAIINLILNLIFIKKFGAYGACIGTVMAEFTVMMYQIIMTKKYINYNIVIKCLLKYVIKSLIMGGFMILVALIIKNIYFKLIVQIVIALLVYFMLNYKYILYDFLGIRARKMNS